MILSGETTWWQMLICLSVALVLSTAIGFERQLKAKSAGMRTHTLVGVNAAEVGWTVGGLNVERFERYFPVSWRKHRRLFDRLVNLQRRFNIKRKMPQGLVAHLGSQWWCMTRATLLAILNDPRRPEFDRFFKTVWIPDESYFQSLARRQSIAIESQSLTVSNFDDQGKPYILYDDHAEMLALSRCFVARKVWSGADKLLSRFPERAGAEHVNDEPRSGRIERIIGAAVKRRRLGRPGLYMQSRFPRENAENGKTAAPYAMLHGFVDLFPDFEKWLQSRVDGDVHGHLFGTDMVEFAGRPTVGPGCLSTHPASRDYDPDGFLTSLIRISDRQQIFQFSPRDRQQLNWFTATDPNATIRMITGAWIVPLMHSDMPFDDVRRMAAILQRTELAHLDILDSVWVKANVEKWDLADFAARPAAILQRVVNDLSFGGWPLYDTPPALRDLTEVGSFLRSLRNAGLQPRNIGDFSPFQTENEWHD